jgi:hypothetical protein
MAESVDPNKMADWSLQQNVNLQNAVTGSITSVFSRQK